MKKTVFSPLRQKYHVTPLPMREAWLYNMFADILATYRSRTAYVKVSSLLSKNHKAAGLGDPSPVERSVFLYDAAKLDVVVDSRGRTWMLKTKYDIKTRNRRRKIYFVFVRV